MSDIVAVVRETIERHRMISPRDTVLVAVSGGPDSVCLLHVLVGLREELGFDVKVAHLDHQFRGEDSTRDAQFVADLSEDLGVPCIREDVNVPRFLLSTAMSKQEAARMLRYQFLIKTSKLEYCQRIATGHNADDQAETVLMRFLRGAGPDGLAGIPAKRDGTIIRPLIRCWRSEIEGYLAEHELRYCVDQSNLESAYHRNQLRNELLPALGAYNPQIAKALVGLGAIMADVSSHFERLTDRALPEVVASARVGQFVLDLAKVASYDEALQRSIFRRIFESFRPDLGPLGHQYVERLLVLASRGEVGSCVELPGRARARLEHGQIVFSHGDGPPVIKKKELAVPGTATFEGANLIIEAKLVAREDLRVEPDEAGDEAAVFDWDAVRPPLVVRPRAEGDRLRPFGMDGTKSLKTLFIDSKIPFSLRSAVPLLCDRSGILWAVGVRRSDAAPVTAETRTVLLVSAGELGESRGIREDPDNRGPAPASGRRAW